MLLKSTENAAGIARRLGCLEYLGRLSWMLWESSGISEIARVTKMRTLICLDWDPDCMFPFTDGLWCHRVSYLCYPLVTVRFRSIPPLPIYSRLGALCSSKLSLLLHPPPILPLPTIPTLLDSLPLPCALLCAAPLQIARRPSSHWVLSPSKIC